MAKITANGDALTITTNITVEQYEGNELQSGPSQA